MRDDGYDLVHFNFAIAKFPLDHPGMTGFTSQLAEINRLAETSPGFCLDPGRGRGWRRHRDVRELARPREHVDVAIAGRPPTIHVRRPARRRCSGAGVSGSTCPTARPMCCGGRRAGRVPRGSMPSSASAGWRLMGRRQTPSPSTPRSPLAATACRDVGTFCSCWVSDYTGAIHVACPEE